MKVYLYANSGNTVGLDATRRCSAVAKLLQEKNCDPILCTCDFRAGTYAKEQLGIKKYVSIDLLSNLPNIMEKGDVLIYDTDEASEFMETNMKDFCTLLYKIPDDIPSIIIDKEFYKKQKKHPIEKIFFFGDDDYNNNLLNICKDSKQTNIPLLWGHYFILENEKELNSYFSEILEEEEYVPCMQDVKYLLSGSLNACIESIECGGKPVLLRRDDKKYDESLIKELHLPSIKGRNLDEIIEKFDSIIKNYPKINYTHDYDIDSIINSISVRIETYRKLTF